MCRIRSVLQELTRCTSLLCSTLSTVPDRYRSVGRSWRFPLAPHCRQTADCSATRTPFQCSGQYQPFTRGRCFVASKSSNKVKVKAMAGSQAPQGPQSYRFVQQLTATWKVSIFGAHPTSTHGLSLLANYNRRLQSGSSGIHPSSEQPSSHGSS